MEPLCPQCSSPTDSLKQYRYVRWCVFLFAGAIYQAEYLRGCPSCIRRQIWRRCWWNLVPANFLWPILFLPWALWLTWASYRPGPSLAVQKGITPQIAAAREAAQHELSWSRVLAIVAWVVCWAPVLGLLFGLLAWFANRRVESWTRLASLLALYVTLAVHVLLLGLLIMDLSRH